MKKNNKIVLKEVNSEVLQQRLVNLKRKLIEYMELTKITDEKVYKYSLEIEYLSSLLKFQEKIHSKACKKQ